MTVEVYRWSADEKEKPYIQSYKVCLSSLFSPHPSLCARKRGEGSHKTCVWWWRRYGGMFACACS